VWSAEVFKGALALKIFGLRTQRRVKGSSRRALVKKTKPRRGTPGLGEKQASEGFCQASPIIDFQARDRPMPGLDHDGILGRWLIESTGRRAAEALSVILDFWFAPPIERSATHMRNTHLSCPTWRCPAP